MDKTVKIYTLCSGSSGNCTYVKCGDTELLIDAGVSRRAIGKALSLLGTSLDRIAAVFVTHEHSDHVKGIPMLAKYHRIPIYVSRRSAGALGEVDPSLLRFLEHPGRVELGEVVVESFPTPHDSLSSCGYTVTYRGRRYGYATDMGCAMKNVADSLAGCEAVILEANYDREMLRYGPYPSFLKQRIAASTGHLDNDTSAAFCSFLGKTGTRRVLLAHLSAENNTPEKAASAVREKLLADRVDLSFAVARRSEPTELLVWEGEEC